MNKTTKIISNIQGFAVLFTFAETFPVPVSPSQSQSVPGSHKHDKREIIDTNFSSAGQKSFIL